MTRNIYFIEKLVRSANDLRRLARRTILLNNRWFFQFLLDDIFHADSLIISNRMSNYVQYARKCSTTYIRESLRAFRSTLQIGHLLLVFKRKRMKRNLRLYRDEKTLLSPCPSLSPALCVLLVRRVACVHPSLIAGKLPSISMSLSFGILASVARSSFFLRLPLIAYRYTANTFPRSRAFLPLPGRFARHAHGLRSIHEHSIYARMHAFPQSLQQFQPFERENTKIRTR